MASNSAVILMLRESEQVSPKPLLLEKLWFAPAAAWLRKNLQLSGVERFLIITEQDYVADVAPCFPADAVVVSAEDAALSDQLTAFANGQGYVAICNTYLSRTACAALVDNAPAAPINSVILNALQSRTAFPVMSGAVAMKSRKDVAAARALMRQDVMAELSANGVQVLDENNVYLDPDVTVGFGSILLPGTILRGNTVIGEDCEIGPNSMIRDCVLGDGCVANSSQLNEAVFGKKVNIGPFAYVRPGTHVGDGCKVGDFTELKNANLGAGTKIPHLIYVGDADVGERCNFGCGSITCNYDGNVKSRTTVGNDCFIGCNTNLVAPCTVEDGAFTAAGTTVTDVAPKDALILSRVRPTVKEGWAAAHRAKKVKK